MTVREARSEEAVTLARIRAAAADRAVRVDGIRGEGVRRDHYRRSDGSLRPAILMAKFP